jgi:hypothetical protein
MLVRCVIVTAACALAVIVTPPEPADEATVELPISPYTSELQRAPVVIVSPDGAMTYHGEAVADLAALDVLLAAHVPDPAHRVGVVQAADETDASLVIAISAHLEQAGYRPLYALKRRY